MFIAFIVICVTRVWQGPETSWQKCKLWNKSWCVKTAFTFDFLFTLNEIANPLNSIQNSAENNISPVFSLLRDDDEEDGEKAAQRQNNRSMLSYFSASAGGGSQNSPDQMHRFFSDRKLKSLDTLWIHQKRSRVSDTPSKQMSLSQILMDFETLSDKRAVDLKQYPLCITSYVQTQKSLKLCSYWTLFK